MSKREDYERRTEALIQPILDRLGFVLWDVEYVKEGADHYLRAYIDKENGITIDDCVEVSRALSDELDREDFIDEAYILEVSSPGLGRALKKDKDFKRNLGKMIEIKLFKPYENLGKEFEAELVSFDAQTINVMTDKDEEITIDRDNIALCRLAFEF